MVHVEYDDFGEYIEIYDEKTGEFVSKKAIGISGRKQTYKGFERSTK